MSKKKKPQHKYQKPQQKPTSQLAKSQHISKEKKRKEAQRRFVERKKNSQTVKPIFDGVDFLDFPESFLNTSSTPEMRLDSILAEKQQLEYEVNYRIKQIKDAGLTSRAVERIEHETGHEFLDFSAIETREDLIREITRARVFLGDDGSTIPGARIETAQIYGEQYKGKFGNEYNTEEHNFARFDTKAIDPEVAKRAFESYRKIEEIRAAELANSGGYGSENMIIALYDAEIRGQDSLVYGMDLLNALKLKNEDEWEFVTQDYNIISPMTVDLIDNIIGRRLF